MANIPGTSIPQPGVPIGAPSGATPIGMSGASSVVPTASPISSSVTDTIKGLTAPVNTPEYSAQLSKVVQDLVKQLGNAPSATSPDKKIPDTNISTPTPGITPSPTGVKDLLSNTAIDQLGKKIQTQLDNLGAGIPTTGSSQMLSDLMTKFGVSGAQDALNTYNQTILKEKQQIANLPEAIKNTLAGVGINQDQLTRLVAKESLPHEKALNEAMAQAGAQEKQITNALDFVKLFSNAAEKDRAAQLEIAKFQITSNLGLYKVLQATQKKALTLAIDMQKQLMTDKNNALKLPMPTEISTAIQNATDRETVQRLSAPYEQQSKAIQDAKNLAPSLAEQIKGMSASNAHNLITSTASRLGVSANDLIGMVENESKLSFVQQKEATQQKDQVKLGTWLTGKTGVDGFVSPEDFKNARSAWVSDGYSADNFDKFFSNFVNPSRGIEYGIGFKTTP